MSHGHKISVVESAIINIINGPLKGIGKKCLLMPRQVVKSSVTNASLEHNHYFIILSFKVIHKRDGVSNNRRLHRLLNCWFWRRSKNTSKLRVTGLCEGNSPVTGEIPTKRANDAEMFKFDDVIKIVGGLLWAIVVKQTHCKANL